MNPTAAWIDSITIGQPVILPDGQAVSIARYGNTLGVWSHSQRCWRFGGPQLLGRSLRGIRHWLAWKYLVAYQSTLTCDHCGAVAQAKIHEGLYDNDRPEEVNAIEAYAALDPDEGGELDQALSCLFADENDYDDDYADREPQDDRYQPESYRVHCPTCGWSERWVLDERDLDAYVEAEIRPGDEAGEQCLRQYLDAAYQCYLANDVFTAPRQPWPDGDDDDD